MTITVNTNQYQISNGRKPRGYGGWFFYSKNTGPGTAYTVGMPDNMQELVWGTGTYTEMKKVAIAKAKEEGITEIIVGASPW